jgi:hypothetical protein
MRSRRRLTSCGGEAEQILVLGLWPLVFGLWSLVEEQPQRTKTEGLRPKAKPPNNGTQNAHP